MRGPSRWIGLVALGWTVLVPTNGLRAQPLVRVRAETRIEIGTRRDGSRLVVEGALRDDLGLPLSQRELLIELHESTANGQVRHRERVRTTSTGAFAASFALATGIWYVQVGFAGDEHFGSQTVTREVRLDREHVQLDVEIEGGSTVDLDVPEHPMRVRARSRAGGAGLSIGVRENGRTLAQGTTDAAGEVVFSLRSADLGPPGAARLVVRSEADAHRGDAETEVPIVRRRATALTLDVSADPSGPDPSVRLSGRLMTSEGPLSRRAVGLWARERGWERHLATALTDDEGTYAVTLSQAEIGALDGDVLARFEADAPWWGPSEAPPVRLRVDLVPAATPWAWIVGSLLTTVAAFEWAGRRRRLQTDAPADVPMHAPAVELGVRRTLLPDSFEVSGQVVDARHGLPLAGAVVHASRGSREVARAECDASGRFAFVLPAGVFTLQFEARGHAPTRHRASLPHRGEWSSVRVRLRSLRDLAWEPLRAIATRVLPSADLWGIWTARDLERAVRAHPNAPRSFAMLVAMVERACYGRLPPTFEDVQEIRSAAAATLQQMAPAPPHGARTDRG